MLLNHSANLSCITTMYIRSLSSKYIFKDSYPLAYNFPFLICTTQVLWLLGQQNFVIKFATRMLQYNQIISYTIQGCAIYWQKWIGLEQWSAHFFCKGPARKYIQSEEPYSLCHNLATLTLQFKCSQRQCTHEQAWPYWVYRQQFADLGLENNLRNWIQIK